MTVKINYNLTNNSQPPECVQSFYDVLQLQAAGKQSYRMSATYTMTECGNAQVDLILVDYHCIPGQLFTLF